VVALALFMRMSMLFLLVGVLFVMAAALLFRMRMRVLLFLWTIAFVPVLSATHDCHLLLP